MRPVLRLLGRQARSRKRERRGVQFANLCVFTLLLWPACRALLKPLRLIRFFRLFKMLLQRRDGHPSQGGWDLDAARCGISERTNPSMLETAKRRGLILFQDCAPDAARNNISERANPMMRETAGRSRM